VTVTFDYDYRPLTFDAWSVLSPFGCAQIESGIFNTREIFFFFFSNACSTKLSDVLVLVGARIAAFLPAHK
jgi:hypothetical protein